MANAVGNDFAHEKHRVVHEQVVQGGSKRLEAPTGFRRRVRIRPKRSSSSGNHVDALPKTSRAANTTSRPLLEAENGEISRLRWEVAGTGRGAAAGRVVGTGRVVVAERVGVEGRSRLGRLGGCGSGSGSRRTFRVGGIVAIIEDHLHVSGPISVHDSRSDQPRRARARSSCAFDILERPSIPRSFASS